MSVGSPPLEGAAPSGAEPPFAAAEGTALGSGATGGASIDGAADGGPEGESGRAASGELASGRAVFGGSALTFGSGGGEATGTWAPAVCPHNKPHKSRVGAVARPHSRRKTRVNR